MAYVDTQDSEKQYSAFRIAERLYRAPTRATVPKKNRKKGSSSRPPPNAVQETDFSRVICFHDIEVNSEENKKKIHPVSLPPDESVQSQYFSPIRRAYTIEGHEGFIVIPCPFTLEQQKYWIRRIIKDLPLNTPNNVTNLTKNEQLWSEWSSDLMPKLRWASLGYHFQWTERLYEDDKRGAFPQDLQEMCRDFAKQFGYDMMAEAAIVNYYPTKQVMGGHLDDAEEDMSVPIVSMSFGNTAVFLLGGRTREEEPVAVYLQSGDVVLMGGESRYCYHGVPRIIEGTCPLTLLGLPPTSAQRQGDGTGDSGGTGRTEGGVCGGGENVSDWEDCAMYLKNARLNVNARQVKKPGT
eukprot:GFYU01009629.1.p1 GENE.GFYU01009629.1~~GFYU01009629.1.p1  ORF type:complete len:352 (+),score=89.98 GFYU01009629.1:109-1164(+)